MKMWDLCLTYADKHDTAMFERWKDDMDGILIYVRVSSRSQAHAAQFTPRNSSLDRYILCDRCCICHRKLQVPEARSNRRILSASSKNHTRTCWHLKRRSLHSSDA